MPRKHEKVRLWYPGRESGLTDVKFQVMNPDGTRTVTDGVATESGSTAKYYYEIPSADVDTLGNWVWWANSASKPKAINGTFWVERKAVGGGGGGAECMWDRKDMKRLWTELKALMKDKSAKEMANDHASITVRLDHLRESLTTMQEKVVEDKTPHVLESLEELSGEVKELTTLILKTADLEAVEEYLAQVQENEGRGS